jgi:patatin-like phospholipase/acyl hydrolase
MAKYRILSLDGGGLRGLITVRLLQQLEGSPSIAGWLDQVDLVAGTSTGGIIALGLAAGRSLDDMGELYLERGPKIFDDSVLDDVLDLGQLVGAQYSSRALRRELRTLFGNRTLRGLRRKVAIPAFDLDYKGDDGRYWKPKIFHNFGGLGTDKDMAVARVALYTAAAPTYFPSADGFVDGGVFANNPSMIALSQAISQKNRTSERASIDEIVLLSVGTGQSHKYIRGQKVDWGYAQWAKPLVDILMEGVAGISDYQCRQILQDRYHRLQVIFDDNEPIGLDDVARLPRMDEIGRTHPVAATRRWIADHWI